MNQSGYGRMINVSSGGGSFSDKIPGPSAYGAAFSLPQYVDSDHPGTARLWGCEGRPQRLDRGCKSRG